MNFSIRSLLGVTLVVALGFLLIRGWMQSHEARVELARTRAETEKLRASLTSQQLTSDHEQWSLDELEWLSSFAATAKKAREDLIDRQSRLEIVDEDVVSLRAVVFETDAPQSTTSEIIYSVHVPESRPVWLASAVVSPDDSSNMFYQGGRDAVTFLTDTPYTTDGPSQHLLAAGTHKLKFTTDSGVDSKPGIEVHLDGQQLLSTIYLTTAKGTVSNGYNNSRSQKDFATNSELPWLFSARIRLLGTQPGGGLSEESESIHFWLTDRDPGYSDFSEEQ